MIRPKIEDYIEKSSTLGEVARKYAQSPEMFSYIQALDRYIDCMEQQKETLLGWFDSKIHHEEWEKEYWEEQGLEQSASIANRTALSLKSLKAEFMKEPDEKD